MIGNRKSLLYSVAAILLALPTGQAGAQQPTGGQVVQGAASISQTTSTTTVNQSANRAVINWQGFSVGAGNTAQFNLPSASSAVLNRVVGGNMSQILGNIRSNGQVYLINPHGVVIGNGARIETNRFIASTLDVSDGNFMAGGAMRFQGASENAVVNRGEIVSGAGGVALIARKVTNDGQVRAQGGTASFAAGSEILLQTDNSVVPVAAPGLTQMAQAGIDNNGLIEAARVELRAVQGNAFGLAVNNAGVVRATGVETRDGRVFLTGGSVSNNGEITATRGDRGGDVVVTGETVALGNATRIDVSGRMGGGTVKTGGGWQGGETDIANAQQTTVASGAQIKADATEQGDGGTVVVWADGRTDYNGFITARGGTQGGNGGNAEVSGKQVLTYNGLADLRAPNGKLGDLLLDPYNVTITSSGNTTCTGTCTPSADDSTIDVAQLVAQLNMSNVNVLTSGGGTQDGNITVASDISWTSSNRLTLTADGSIAINANITNNMGDLRLVAGPGASSASPYQITSAGGTTIYVNQLELRTNQFTNVNLAGVVETNALYLDYLGGGSISVANAGNYINYVQLPGSARTMNGNVTVYSAVDELGILGDSGAVMGDMIFKNAGDIRLLSGAVLNTVSGGKVALAAVGGNIINDAGTGAIGADTASYQLYAKDSTGNTLGGLAPTVIHGVAFPNSPLSGNFLYIDDGSSHLPPEVQLANQNPPIYQIQEVAVVATPITPPTLPSFTFVPIITAQNWLSVAGEIAHTLNSDDGNVHYTTSVDQVQEYMEIYRAYLLSKATPEQIRNGYDGKVDTAKWIQERVKAWSGMLGFSIESVVPKRNAYGLSGAGAELFASRLSQMPNQNRETATTVMAALAIQVLAKPANQRTAAEQSFITSVAIVAAEAKREMVGTALTTIANNPGVLNQQQSGVNLGMLLGESRPQYTTDPIPQIQQQYGGYNPTTLGPEKVNPDTLLQQPQLLAAIFSRMAGGQLERS